MISTETMMPAGEDAVGGEGKVGLVVARNETIGAFLRSAAADSDLPGEIRELAYDLSSHTSLPYRSLRAIWSASPPSGRPPLRSLFFGSDFVFESPKPREQSKELKERLAILADMAERKAYQELVRDVVPKEEVVEPFSSYKDQLGFGLHVVLIMFTGYLVGFYAFRALFNHNAAMNAAGGIFGLVCGMLLETLLFIVRTSSKDIRSSSATSELKKNQ